MHAASGASTRQERTTPPLPSLLAALESNRDAQVRSGLRLYSKILTTPIVLAGSNPASRNLVSEKYLSVDGRPITDAIKDAGLKLSSLLNLDEIEATKVVVAAKSTDLAVAVNHFFVERKQALHCLHKIFELCGDDSVSSHVNQTLLEFCRDALAAPTEKSVGVLTKNLLDYLKTIDPNENIPQTDPNYALRTEIRDGRCLEASLCAEVLFLIFHSFQIQSDELIQLLSVLETMASKCKPAPLVSFVFASSLRREFLVRHHYTAVHAD
eukprot:c25999_g1_i1.p1 GENE.c25999_g1_i1~~c25999_g1_i1.p1  ORF type:complete len:268 (-),score=66.61 c25999_g1_i1:828-1631(-)